MTYVKFNKKLTFEKKRYLFIRIAQRQHIRFLEFIGNLKSFSIICFLLKFRNHMYSLQQYFKGNQ